MTIFLTSNMGMCEKINGEIITKKIDNKNNIINQLKNSIKNYKKFVFIASNPTGYEKTDSYSQCTKQSFKMSGMEFSEFIILDARTMDKTAEIISGADVIFLAGGHVPTQNAFFVEIELEKHLQGYDGVLIGQSAGSMNLSSLVYNYPEDLSEMEDSKFLIGLGKTNVTIIPHFERNKANKNIDLFNDYFLPDSKNKEYVLLTDGSHVLVKKSECVVYGEAYLVKNCEITQICKTGQNTKLNIMQNKM